MPPPSTTKAQTHANVTTTATLPYAESETGLSVIMEASQELRSSSSSSGCTTSNTLPGHSVHGLSHPGNFSLSTVHVSRVHHQSQPEEEVSTQLYLRHLTCFHIYFMKLYQRSGQLSDYIKDVANLQYIYSGTLRYEQNV
ncbi:hypothetical protein E2C01_076370 [Portunus trituberculatus]|uniref:Uncharacterized protein n=1 Tax=Portunus trituberculatus TaxID=210409 RepID=A0A5B7IIQ9_PORTR|nr:hypothetical protein [Portunus trituberculatus]